MAKLKVLDFYADWCAPCKAMIPTINSLIEEYNKEGSDVEIRKINVDVESELTQKYEIRGIPALVFVKDGETVATLTGAQSKDKILNKINESLSL